MVQLTDQWTGLQTICVSVTEAASHVNTTSISTIINTALPASSDFCGQKNRLIRKQFQTLSFSSCYQPNLKCKTTQLIEPLGALQNWLSYKAVTTV